MNPVLTQSQLNTTEKGTGGKHAGQCKHIFIKLEVKKNQNQDYGHVDSIVVSQVPQLWHQIAHITTQCSWDLDENIIFDNRLGVAGAVLQLPPSLIHSLTHPLVQISFKHCLSKSGIARELKF